MIKKLLKVIIFLVWTYFAGYCGITGYILWRKKRDLYLMEKEHTERLQFRKMNEESLGD